MIKHYLKYSWQILRKDKLFTWLNILGFAIGITVCSVIAFFILHEFSYDKHNKNYNRIYGLTHSVGGKTIIATTPNILKPTIENKVPGIQKIAQIYDLGKSGTGIIKNNRINQIENGYAADPEIFDIFDFNFISGGKTNFASKINSIVLSESTAKKYFGTVAGLLGKTVELKVYSQTYNLEIAGIFQDCPENSCIIPGLFIRIDKENESIPPEYIRFMKSWKSNRPNTYILLDNSSIKNRVEEAINKIIPDKKEKTYSLLPLADQHLFASNVEYLPGKRGDFDKLQIYMAIGLLTLLIACINYINFSTAKSAMRSKEIGVRKLSGASRLSLAKQLIMEPLILAFITLPIVIVLLLIAFPYIDSIFDRELKAVFFTNWNYVLTVLAIIFSTGALSGVYSAVLISAYKPLELIRNQVRLKTSKSYFRNSLVLAQVVIFSGLIISSSIIYRQMQQVKNSNLGYNKECVLTVQLTGLNYYERAKALINELKKYPGIINGTIASTVPPNIGSTMMRSGHNVETGKDWSYPYLECDENYKDVMGLTLKEGTFFNASSGNDEIVINEKLKNDLGLKRGAGEFVTIGERVKIIGVISNFYLNTLYEPVVPLYMVKTSSDFANIMAIKINPKYLDNSMKMFKEKWAQFFPDAICDYNFVDEELDKKYKDDERFGTLIGVFSVIASFIAVIGLVGLTTYIVSKKKKEVAVRKVLGASPLNIVYVLTKETVIITLLGCAVSAPIVYHYMEKWLMKFVNKIEITPGIFIAAFSITLLITMTSVIYQAVKSATGNQMDSLRSE